MGLIVGVIGILLERGVGLHHSQVEIGMVEMRLGFLYGIRDAKLS